MKYFYTYDYDVIIENGFGDRLDFYSESKTISVWENLQDIFEFLFEQEYHKPYNALSWYLESNANEMYKELEDLWLHNNLDVFDLYSHNLDFKEFIMTKHKNDIMGSIERIVIDDIKTNYNYEDIVLYNIMSDYFEIEGEVHNG